MYTKSMLALGGVLVGAGMFWMRKRYLYEKTRQELKVKCGLQSNSIAHSNIDNNIPAIMDTREQDILYRTSTSADQTHNIDSDVPAATGKFMQCPCVEKPKGFLPLDEITLSERHRQMINREIQKPTVNPIVLLNRIIPGIRYEHYMIYNPLPAISVEAIIYGRPFCACGPTKKAAKLIISYMAMNYFYGYEQQDLMYKPSTSAAESKVDHIIPTTNTRDDDTLYRPSTSADQTNLNNGIPTTNRIEQDILYRPSTSADQTHNIDSDVPETTEKKRLEKEIEYLQAVFKRTGVVYIP